VKKIKNHQVLVSTKITERTSFSYHGEMLSVVEKFLTTANCKNFVELNLSYRYRKYRKRTQLSEILNGIFKR